MPRPPPHPSSAFHPRFSLLLSSLPQLRFVPLTSVSPKFVPAFSSSVLPSSSEFPSAFPPPSPIPPNFWALQFYLPPPRVPSPSRVIPRSSSLIQRVLFSFREFFPPEIPTPTSMHPLSPRVLPSSSFLPLNFHPPVSAFPLWNLTSLQVYSPSGRIPLPVPSPRFPSLLSSTPTVIFRAPQLQVIIAFPPWDLSCPLSPVSNPLELCPRSLGYFSTP